MPKMLNHDESRNNELETSVIHTVDIVNYIDYSIEMVCRKVKITSVLAKNLKALREAHNMTLDELGKEIGVSRQAIWAIENEKSWITIDKIEKLSKTFNIEQDILFQNKTKPK